MRFRYFCQNSMKGSDLEGIVQWDRDRMNGNCCVEKPNVASLLANDSIAELF